MKKWFLAVSLLLVFVLPAFAAENGKGHAFDRIVKSGVIRCGYYVFPPITYRDPNTGALSGLAVDYMNRIADRAGLKVEWAEEVTWANWVPELQAGRFDVACTSMWPELTMMKVVSFTESPFFSGLYPLVRLDDARFDKGGRDRINQPDVTILTQDGNATDTIARDAFPQAKFFTLPPTASSGEFFQALLAKKADVTLTDRNGLYYYEKNNGRNFKFVDETRPIKLQSFPLAVARGEEELLSFLNQAMRELDYSGDTDRILRKWEPEPGKTYLRKADAYKAAGQK